MVPTVSKLATDYELLRQTIGALMAAYDVEPIWVGPSRVVTDEDMVRFEPVLRKVSAKLRANRRKKRKPSTKPR